MLALMVLTSQSRPQRSRIIVMAVVAVIVVVMLIGVLLSFDSIAEMFRQRASFDQSYDERSEERRVGKECRSRCDWSSDVCSSDLGRRHRRCDADRRAAVVRFDRRDVQAAREFRSEL